VEKVYRKFAALESALVTIAVGTGAERGASDVPQEHDATDPWADAAGNTHRLGAECLRRRWYQEEAKETRPLPEGPKALRPGEYRSQEFKPSLSFRGGKGWEVSELQQKPYFDILHEYQGGDYFVAISFNNAPPKVSDPRHPNKLVPSPEDWVS
jgi:hypothetical protein